VAGTSAGGKRAALKNKELHGDDFYAKIGAKGGQNSHEGGFKDVEFARKWGKVGGTKSRRGKAVKDAEDRNMDTEVLDQ
jgi:general stress protein YciG